MRQAGHMENAPGWCTNGTDPETNHAGGPHLLLLVADKAEGSHPSEEIQKTQMMMMMMMMIAIVGASLDD